MGRASDALYSRVVGELGVIATAIPSQDELTALWVRDKSDELAVSRGCWFDWERGAFTVWWIERICRLYEGSQAGEPMVLRGCAECDREWPIPEEWDDAAKEMAFDRMLEHAQCVQAGHRIDWQYDCTMRVFGWTKFSQFWKRPIRRFRRSKIYVAKKNKKSPTQAAWALYMTCGDGESGQHVYLAAKDGSQARDNAGKHIVEMLKQSDELQDECTLNLASLQITHEPTRSTCKPLSSSNARTQKSKEGLNGSVFIDETHVVDREFVARIDRAGISRMEPLHCEFSTSGDDPDSYGKEQFDKCNGIINGELEEIDTFAAVYAAPEQLRDSELAADPLKYGMMANPAMGHTVNPDEFMEDYLRCKGSPADLAKFKMYRLNIWQNSACPWLNISHWDQGETSFTYADMEGRDCWAGLDLSSVSDFSALSLCFPEGGEKYRYLWWFWLPEETVAKMQVRFPQMLRWVTDPRCKLIVTPGARIHFGAIRSEFRELAKRYAIQELAYDDYNAEQFTQEVSEGVTDHHGRVIEPATGIPRINFSQSMATMNEPTKSFEAAVISGDMEHTGDPIARWMAGNATIKPDSNMNYRPLKSADLMKKIDGIPAAIMARARAVLGNGSGYWLTNKLVMGG